MPCKIATEAGVYDTAGTVQEPEPSELIENERRLFYVAITRARKAVFIGTSAATGHGAQSRSQPHLPSRFLTEMQLPATKGVMEALQQLAAGVGEAREALLAAVSRFGGVRHLMRSLVSGYLGEIGDPALIGEVARQVAQCPETPFTYPSAYDAPAVGKTTPSAPVGYLHAAWEAVNF